MKRGRKSCRASSEVRRAKEELAAARREHEQARANDDHSRAGELRFGTMPLLEKKLAEAEAKLAESGGRMVRDMVSERTWQTSSRRGPAIPVAKMLEEEAEKLLEMEGRLARARHRAGRGGASR